MLLAIISAKPLVPRPTNKMPFPSVPLIVLVTVSVRSGVHALPAPATSLPPAILFPPPRLAVCVATMVLLFTVPAMSA